MVKLIHITPNAEQLIAYIARVSSINQDNPEYEKLISYLIKMKHWSPFEMVNFCVEINTSRAIAQQILRHRSFSFQEFSMRYSEVPEEITFVGARRQDKTNRQNSFDDLSTEDRIWFLEAQEKNWKQLRSDYQEALNRGIAKESARFLLPLGTPTKIYMNGNVRSWITYIMLRTEESTQFEHREIALQIKDIFIQEFPITAKALGWVQNNS